MVATTNTIVGPTGRETGSNKCLWSHLQEKWSVTERLVNKVAVDFFADQETGLPTKTVLERYIGPDFDVPMIMAI